MINKNPAVIISPTPLDPPVITAVFPETLKRVINIHVIPYL